MCVKNSFLLKRFLSLLKQKSTSISVVGLLLLYDLQQGVLRFSDFLSGCSETRVNNCKIQI